MRGRPETLRPVGSTLSSSSHPIEVRNLSKSYGPVRALENVSFEVREGEIMGFLGPNGAGKSTTLRILAGFLPGDSGEVHVAGHDVRSDSRKVRQSIGYLPEGVPLYPEMRVSEYLRFRSRLKGIPLARRRKQIAKSLEAAGVKEVRRRIVGTLSRGYRQRVGIADALLNDPQVLILDEPTVGLDPEQVRQLRTLLRDVGRDRTVILSTHILREVELVCSSVVIISEGRIAARDRSDRLRAMADDQACVIVEVSGPVDRIVTAFQAITGVSRVSRDEAECAAEPEVQRKGGSGNYRRFKIYSNSEDDLREKVYCCVQQAGWLLRHLEREVLSMEEVFLSIVGKRIENSE